VKVFSKELHRLTRVVLHRDETDGLLALTAHRSKLKVHEPDFAKII
jgi:hypothetical protein